MATREIHPALTHTACEVCGRTLLRGERAQVYLQGGNRHEVCELCTGRAIAEGWVREGTLPPYDGRDSAANRRPSLLGRLRPRRDRRPEPEPEPDLSEELGDNLGWTNPLRGARRRAAERERIREPRHVHAIPTREEQKISSAIEAFNRSEYRRTLAGVARSLGLPAVSVRPIDGRPGLVSLMVSWELCWYGYEVDLADEYPEVRLARQGYELDELEPLEREPNTTADEHGSLSFHG